MIWIDDGLYATGGRTVGQSMRRFTNRAVVSLEPTTRLATFPHSARVLTVALIATTVCSPRWHLRLSTFPRSIWMSKHGGEAPWVVWTIREAFEPNLEIYADTKLAWVQASTER